MHSYMFSMFFKHTPGRFRTYNKVFHHQLSTNSNEVTFFMILETCFPGTIYIVMSSVRFIFLPYNSVLYVVKGLITTQMLFLMH